jgi:hypothetical protein
MDKEFEVLTAILKESQETKQLLKEIKATMTLIAKKILPEKAPEELILKGGPVAEITVYSPEKLEEWMSIFEKKGLRVEFSEPSTGDRNYFAKIWGYLEKPIDREDKEVKEG